ncbi:MAG: hypothetical protein Q9208_003101 [Pyrenodesmia sp. 3 TL-2023]
MTPCVWAGSRVVGYCAEIRKAVPNPNLHSPTTATTALQGSKVIDQDPQSDVLASVLPNERIFNGETPPSLRDAITTPAPRLSAPDNNAVECQVAPVHGRHGRYQGGQEARMLLFTFTFGPRELSTVQGANQLVTSEFNFADLPCPPESLTRGYEQIHRIYAPYSNSSKTYAPFIAPFPQIYDLDARFRLCNGVRYEGVYPAHALEPAREPTPADNDVRFGPKRFKDEDDDDENDKKDKEKDEEEKKKEEEEKNKDKENDEDKKNDEEENKDEKEEEKDKEDKQEGDEENKTEDEDGDGGRRPDRSRRHHLIRSPENAHLVPKAPKETNLNAHQLRPVG